jgi:hypothetical protein
MPVRRQLLYLSLLFFTHDIAHAERGPCPAGSAAIHFHSPGSSQMMVSTSINHSGPYEFTVDTGSDITVMDPKLATELRLQPQGSVRTGFMSNSARADLVKPEVVEVGLVSARDLVVAVEGLKQVQALYPKVRGILGENFLSRFDLLIDYRHRVICMDGSKELQKLMKGERVEVIRQREPEGDLAYTLPILVTVHMPGDGENGTVLRIDSGSSEPILFENHVEPLSWQCARRIAVAGGKGSPLFAAMPSQGVRIGSRLTSQIAFITPIGARREATRTGEDGVLPTALFKRIFISYSDHFVMFEPQ